MLKRLFDAEPVIVRGIVLLVFMLANDVAHIALTDWAKMAINLAAVGVYALITRAKVTPNARVLATTPETK